jgi:glycosyltransferase involved in cell wall biosynthesis
MVYIAWFIFFFTILQLVIAFVNLIFYPKLPDRTFKAKPLVSILIPARNEEFNICNILDDILQQDYSEIEVIVFNDISSDRTAEIVKEYALIDKRITLIDSDFLPHGWLGKNWACHSLSKKAKGDYFLFLDADVRINNGIIVNAVSFAKHFKLALISIFPKQIIKTFGEKITVPNMNYILLSLLPLILVRKSGMSSLSAANGQFMFFDSSIYMSLEPHEKMKNNKVEDIEISRYLKYEKHRIACLVGDRAIQCRMYNGFNDAVNGFSKNVTAFFGNSIILALLFWIITTFGFLFIMIELPIYFFIIYLFTYIMSRILISIVSEQSVTENIFYIIPMQISFGLFIFHAFTNKNIKTYRWKDRDIK